MSRIGETKEDRAHYKPRMDDATKLRIIREWDSGLDSCLQHLATRLGLQRNQVSRVLTTRLNYVTHRGRPFVYKKERRQ